MVTKAEIKYNIWTSGCQMNKSDSEMLAGQFDSLGITPNESYADSDIIVLNTCVVRLSAENNAISLLEKIKLQDLLKAAEEETNKPEINDQSKYLVDQKIEVLKSLN